MYLYLSSDDSKKYYPNNNPAMFSTKLPKNIRTPLNGNWQIALLDIELPPLETGYEPKFLTVYSDICSSSVYGGGLKQILHRMYYKELRQQTPIVFIPTRYKEVNIESLDYIHLYLLDEHGNSPSFVNSPLLCTLHIRKNPAD